MGTAGSGRRPGHFQTALHSGKTPASFALSIPTRSQAWVPESSKGSLANCGALLLGLPACSAQRLSAGLLRLKITILDDNRRRQPVSARNRALNGVNSPRADLRRHER